MKEKHMKTKLFLLSAMVPIAIFFMIIPGCSDDTVTTGPPANDTSAINFNNLIINERTIPFATAYSSVDLYHGIIVQEESTYKDAVLTDTNSTVFQFRSGDLSLLDMPPGFMTSFKDIFEYTNITQAQFDTAVTRIPDTDSNLTPQDFTSDITSSFTAPLASHPVFGFCLTGRYQVFAPKYVFGMIYLDSAWRENDVFKLRFDVKINKNGENRFARN